MNALFMMIYQLQTMPTRGVGERKSVGSILYCTRRPVCAPVLSVAPTNQLSPSPPPRRALSFYISGP